MGKDRLEFYDKNADFNFLANTIEGFPINVKLGKKGQAVKNLDIACTETLFQVSKGLANQTNSRNEDACFSALENDRKYTTGGASAGYGGNHVLKYNDPNNPYRDGAKYTGADYPTTHLSGDPLDFKERLMYEALMMKATQHPYILKWLLDPQNVNKDIIENTALAPSERHDDPYWGNGRAGNGRNALGKLWKLVQQDLKTEMKTNGEVQVRSGFSPNVASLLGVESQQFDQTKAITKQKLNTLPTTDKANLPAYTGNSHVYSSNMGTDPSNAQIFTSPKTATKAASVTPIQNAASLPPIAPALPPAAKSSVEIPKVDYAPTAHQTALNVFKAINTNVQKFQVADDTTVTGKKVLRLEFNSDQDAKDFLANAKKYNISIDEKQIRGKTLTIGENKAHFIFDKFGIDSFGKTNHHDLIDSVIHESQNNTELNKARKILKTYNNSVEIIDIQINDKSLEVILEKGHASTLADSLSTISGLSIRNVNNIKLQFPLDNAKKLLPDINLDDLKKPIGNSKKVTFASEPTVKLHHRETAPDTLHSSDVSMDKPPSFHSAPPPPQLPPIIPSGANPHSTSVFKPNPSTFEGPKSSGHALESIKKSIHKDIFTSKIEEISKKAETREVLLAQFSSQDLRKNDKTKDLVEKIDKIAVGGSPLQKMDNTKPEAPQFKFQDNEYKVTVPKNFSGEVFVPRLDQNYKITGHDLLAYKNGELDPKHSVIDTSNDMCKVERKILEQCRTEQHKNYEAALRAFKPQKKSMSR